MERSRKLAQMVRSWARAIHFGEGDVLGAGWGSHVFLLLTPKAWCLSPPTYFAGDIMDSSSEAPPISIKSRTHSVSAGE